MEQKVIIFKELNNILRETEMDVVNHNMMLGKTQTKKSNYFFHFWQKQSPKPDCVLLLS